MREGTLGQFNLPFVVSQQLKNSPKVGQMILKGMTVRQDIVEKDKNTLAEQGFKGTVHGALEGCRGSSEAEGHNLKFKMAEVRLERSFELLACFHSDLVKARVEIQSGKPGSASQLVH